MTPPLRIEILGPLRVLRQNQPVAVGAHRLQALLAVLALRANQVCTPEELLDLVWHDNPPGSGLKVLPPYIYRLRRILPADVLDRTADGYVLHLSDGSSDVTDFESAASRAARHRDAGELDAAAREYRHALALFRGEPLTGLPGPYLAGQRQRLIEHHDQVFGERVDVDLVRGRAAELVAELVPVVAARPFDERLVGQLMHALGADGRQADALELYTRTRQTLIDQLGVEPGSALRAIHRTILRNESAGARDELPRAGSTFVGRAAELDRLIRTLGTLDAAVPPIVTIDGMAGAGKTALALQAARQLSTRYPDGVLFVDLHGHTPGRPPRDIKSALDQLLVGAGVAVTKIPHVLEAAQGLWRTTLAGRRLLILLDNAASSAAVAGLLPGSPSCGVLITSRNQLTGLDTQERLHLDVLAPDDAAALLAQQIGARRTGQDVAASNGLAERCGHLPLALRIAGARLRQRPNWTVAQINERLDRVGRRLTELSSDGLAVSATFALSYDQLDAEQQHLFRLLSLLPGRDLDQYGAAALIGCDPDDAADLAESLVDANLLIQPVPGRYELHDLLREYAGSLAHDTDPPAALDAATDRLLEYYLNACLHPLSWLAGMRYVGPVAPTELAVPDLDTQEKSDAWADAEAGNLAAAVEHAAGSGRPVATWQLALAAVSFLTRRGMIQVQDRVLELAATAARALGDREAESRVLHATGRLIRGQRGTHEAIARLEDALDRLPADGDLLLRGQIHCGIGHAYQQVDPYGQGLPNLEEAIRIGRTLGDERLLSQGLTYLGILYNNQHEIEKAIRTHEEAVTIQRRLGPSGLMADALSGLAFSYLQLGRYQESIERSTAALEVALEVKNPYAPPFVLAHLAEAHRLNGELETALAFDRRAVAAAEASGMLAAKWTTRLGLGESLLAVGDVDGAEACFLSILDAATADKNTAYLMDAWECLSKHALVTGDRDKAVGYLGQAIAAAEDWRSPQVQRLRDQLEALTA